MVFKCTSISIFYSVLTLQDLKESKKKSINILIVTYNKKKVIYQTMFIYKLPRKKNDIESRVVHLDLLHHGCKYYGHG